jgi:hypothetical protein
MPSEFGSSIGRFGLIAAGGYAFGPIGAAAGALLDIAGLQRRHRARRVLRLFLDPRHSAALADPFGFLRPWSDVPALMASAPPSTPPSTGSGVVVCLMG